MSLDALPPEVVEALELVRDYEAAQGRPVELLTPRVRVWFRARDRARRQWGSAQDTRRVAARLYDAIRTAPPSPHRRGQAVVWGGRGEDWYVGDEYDLRRQRWLAQMAAYRRTSEAVAAEFGKLGLAAQEAARAVGEGLTQAFAPLRALAHPPEPPDQGRRRR